jgi:hypothetical protein
MIRNGIEVRIDIDFMIDMDTNKFSRLKPCVQTTEGTYKG